MSLYKWAVVHDRWAGKYVKVYFEAGMGKYRFYDVESRKGPAYHGEWCRPDLIRLANKSEFKVPFPIMTDEKIDDLDKEELSVSNGGDLAEALFIRGATLCLEVAGKKEGVKVTPAQIRTKLEAEEKVMVPIPGSEKLWDMSKGATWVTASADAVPLDYKGVYQLMTLLKVDPDGKLIMYRSRLKNALINESNWGNILHRIYC